LLPSQRYLLKNNYLNANIAGAEAASGYSKPGPLSSKQNRRGQQQAASQEVEAEEEVRYEPITEAFIFEQQIIHPCYVVLPFSTQEDIDRACRPYRNVRKKCCVFIFLK
jgi:hypothetical protein